MQISNTQLFKKKLAILQDKKTIKTLVRKDPTKARIFVDRAIRDKRISKKLISKGVISKQKIKITTKDGKEIYRSIKKVDYDKLDFVLSKDKQLRKEFYNIVGEKAKKAGLGNELSNEKIGSIISGAGITVGQTSHLLEGASLSLASATEYNKLINLGDDLSKFTKGNFSVFITKYKQNAGFREKVNQYLQMKIKNDPELSALKGVSSENIVSSIASLKRLKYSTFDILRDMHNPGLKNALKNSAYGFAHSHMVLGNFLVSALNTNIIGTIIPNSNQVYWSSIESFSSVFNRFNTLNFYGKLNEEQQLLNQEEVTSI